MKKAIAVTAGLLILGGAFFYLNSSNIQIAKPTMPLQKANPPAFNPDVSIPATPEVQTELPDSTTPSLARQKTVELQEGTVSGKVTDVATGAPLPGITVTATDTSTQSSEPQSQSAITEIDGTYRITGLLVSPNAAFQVKCDSPDGFRKLTYSKRPTAVFAGTLHVENIDIALEPEALLSGIVVDPQNAPVSDAEVVLAGGIDEHVGATVRSVADGSFVFRSLPPAGDLFIMARVADGAVSEPMAIALPETGLTDLVIVVLEACSVSGTIVDTSGNPLPGLEARALRVPADRIGSGANGHADENGQFEIRGLPPGQYELVVLGSKLASHGSQQKGVGIGLEPGQQLTDVQLVYNRDLSISGVVLDSSNVPIPGAEVSASSVDFGGGVRATTDASGRFTVTDLEEGNYSLQVNAPGHQYVDVYGVEAGSEGVEIVVADPFRVTGRVVDSETGKPITEFEISTQSHWGDPADANITEEFRKRSSLDGSFELVQEQAYPIILTARGEGYATGYTILDLTGPPYTREVELRLDPGGDLQGSVVDSSGTAVADALIFLGPVYTYGNRSVAKSANDGSFQLQAFPNTTQRISAYKPGYATGSVVVDPSTDGDEPVRIILPNGATIQGTLTFAPSMETVPCTIEMVYPERHSVQGSAVDLQPDGSYIIERVQPGDATVCARVNTQASFADRIMLKKNVHVTDRGTHTVDFYIQSATGAIEGTVRFPDGAHPSHVQVNVTVETTAGLVGKSDVVKHSGAFSFEGLPAGKGTVQIQASFQNHTFIEKIMSMEVREDKTSSLNIEI